MLTPEQLEEARRIFAEEARKERMEQKRRINEAQEIKAHMSTEEKIRFVNTPYKDIPGKLKPGMTKFPQKFHFVHIHKHHLGVQQETLAARIIRFRDKYDLSRVEFLNICNTFAERHDLPGQRTRLTNRDIVNYEDFNICPKIDKMVVMADAMGIDIDYFAGYGSASRDSKNEFIHARYRKKKSKQSEEGVG